MSWRNVLAGLSPNAKTSVGWVQPDDDDATDSVATVHATLSGESVALSAGLAASAADDGSTASVQAVALAESEGSSVSISGSPSASGDETASAAVDLTAAIGQAAGETVATGSVETHAAADGSSVTLTGEAAGTDVTVVQVDASASIDGQNAAAAVTASATAEADDGVATAAASTDAWATGDGLDVSITQSPPGGVASDVGVDAVALSSTELTTVMEDAVAMLIDVEFLPPPESEVGTGSWTFDFL